jgi:hypothetical protein
MEFGFYFLGQDLMLSRQFCFSVLLSGKTKIFHCCGIKPERRRLKPMSDLLTSMRGVQKAFCRKKGGQPVVANPRRKLARPFGESGTILVRLYCSYDEIHFFKTGLQDCQDIIKSCQKNKIFIS